MVTGRAPRACPHPDTPGIVDLRLRRRPDGVHVDVVAPGGIDRRDAADRVRAGLAAAGAPRATVTVAAIDALARDPRTGKKRMVV